VAASLRTILQFAIHYDFDFALTSLGLQQTAPQYTVSNHI